MDTHEKQETLTDLTDGDEFEILIDTEEHPTVSTIRHRYKSFAMVLRS